jgi:hypothetical protein
LGGQTRFNVAMLRRSTVALAFLLGACGASEGTSPDSLPPSTPVPTVPGVGRLPDTIPRANARVASDVEVPVSVVVTRPVDEDGAVLDTIAEQVNGNRLIVVGDSILASTASRYGGELCAGLNPLGWSVEVDAEPGRFVEFGNEVLEARLPDPDSGVDGDDDFDAAIVHLGSNYDSDRENYLAELNEILFRVAPRPMLLLTVTEYRPAWSEVNQTIRDLAGLYDNVTVVDWEKIARTPGVLSRDGLHPGDQGEDVLVELLAVALGEVAEDDGECLRSPFTDDSAVGRGSSPGGGSSSGGSSSGGSSSGGSSSGGSSSGGSSSGTSSGGSTSGGTTTGGGSTTGTTTGTTTGGDTGGVTTGGDTTGGETTGGDTTGGDTTGGETTGGSTTGGDTAGTTTGGETTGGETGGSTGSTSGGTTTGGTTTGGSTSGGTTSGGTTTGGSTTSGGTTSGGSTSGGSTSGGTTTGGTTTGGTTTGGTTTGGSTTSGGTTSGGSTTGGTTSGGSTTGGSTTTGGTDTGGDGG